MLKSKLFTFNEQNLNSDIEKFRAATGTRVDSLQCNNLTMKIWREYTECKYPYIDTTDKDGYIAKYHGIPIVINENLDDGTIGIS